MVQKKEKKKLATSLVAVNNNKSIHVAQTHEI
jgi:hypothetical protein